MYSNDLKYILLIIGLLIAILIIVLITKALIDNALDQEAEKQVDEYLDSINYYKRMSGYLYALFGTNKVRRSIKTSNQMVSNFSSYQQLKYLSKYFDLVITDETIDDLKGLRKLVSELIAIDFENKRVPEKIRNYIPCMIMYYISPQGKSQNVYKLYLFPSKIDELIKQIDVANKRQMAPNYQRSRMTKQMRESVLARDNWTCQKCGNSVYNEPNLLLEVDHIIPISMGGKTEPNNLQTLCWKCNREKSDNIDFL